jgi:hypothetical protein
MLGSEQPMISTKSGEEYDGRLHFRVVSSDTLTIKTFVKSISISTGLTPCRPSRNGRSHLHRFGQSMGGLHRAQPLVSRPAYSALRGSFAGREEAL